ncbi:MAG: TOBE domain-containing protein, partial [Alphaproteobacteria bacterium]
LRDGAAIEVLIRPEAIRLSAIAGERPAAVARVAAARMLGRSSLIHLDMGDRHADGDDAHRRHLHSRMPGRFLPPEGETLAVALDLAQTFVFPREAPP